MTGNLGAGKTFFIRGICQNFDIEEVTSPTFSIINQYEGRIRVIHFDFYRIKSIAELYDIGIEEYLDRDDILVFIEWSDRFPDILPGKRIEIDFEYLDETSRKISVAVYDG